MEHLLKFFKGLTPKRIEMLQLLIKALVGGFIGLSIVILYNLVVLIILLVGIFGDKNNSIQLINTAIAMIGPEIGGIFGYFLGRGSGENPNVKTG